MPRPSTISKLPAELREQIGKLRRDGVTIDEILDTLRALGAGHVSRSALGRHVRQLDAIGETIRRQRIMAEALIDHLGDAPKSKSTQLNVHLAHGLLTKMMVSEDGEAVTLDPQEAMLTAKAVHHLAAAEKADADAEARIRKDLIRRAEKSLGAIEAEAEGGRIGLADALRRVRAEVYGIVD